jgi:hypothetical protein
MVPFEPDGVYAGIPYRVHPDASIEAMLPGGLVKFKNLDQLLATVEGAQAVQIVTTHTIMPQGALETLGNRRGSISALPTSTRQNWAQTWAGLYELERVELQPSAQTSYSAMSVADLARHINEIALAVARIEANATDNPRRLSFQQQSEQLNTDQPLSNSARNDRSNPQDLERIDVLDAEHSTPSKAVQALPLRSIPRQYPDQYPAHRLDEPNQHSEEVVLYARGRNIFFGILLVGIVLIGAAIVSGTLWQFLKSSPPIEDANNTAKFGEALEILKASINRSPKLPFPLPGSYGIYALSDNKLLELKPLPINVPDARIQLSAEIKKPSTTTIDDKPAFILFRRDLLNNAPQKLTLRVVARIERETKFIDGKPTVTKLDEEWRVRSKSYDLKVSPIDGEREMVMARLEDNSSLPAGRYALVLNRAGYDFTVKGPIVAPEQCLEQFETTNSAIYSECRAP